MNWTAKYGGELAHWQIVEGTRYVATGIRRESDAIEIVSAHNEGRTEPNEDEVSALWRQAMKEGWGYADYCKEYANLQNT